MTVKLRVSAFACALALVSCSAARAPSPVAAPAASSRSGASASGPAIEGVPKITWRIEVGASLDLTEELCWQGFTPRRLFPELPAAARWAKATRDGSPLEVTPRGVAVQGSSGCVQLSIDLDAAARGLGDEATLMSIGPKTVYGSFDAWLWRPDVWPRDTQSRMFVTAAPGTGVSAPFLTDAEGAFVVPLSAWSMMARGAVGQLDTDEFDVASGRLAVSRLPGTFPKLTRAGIRKALTAAAAAVATIDGKMPAPRVQIFLRPSGRGGQAVRFGMAMRGGGPSVMLLVSPAATDASIYGEWIAVHELSHLWLVPLDAGDSWLAEGLASYYQCILRSRVGMYDETRGWDELVSGLQRGKEEAGRTPLRDARSPSYQHMYWGGAAVALKLDVLLRKNGRSLDAVLSEVRRKYPADDGDPSLDEVLGRLEAAAGIPLKPLVDAWIAVPFPDTSGELHELGVVPRGSTVVLDPKASQRAIRMAIAGRRQVGL